MWTLIGLGTAAAYLSAVAATWFRVVSAVLCQDGRIGGLILKAARSDYLLTAVGQMLELKAAAQTLRQPSSHC